MYFFIPLPRNTNYKAMKRFYLFVIFAITIASCNKMPEMSRSDAEKAIIENLIPTTEITVTPTSDVAVVLVNGYPIASVTTKSTVNVTKDATPVIEQLTQEEFDAKYAGFLSSNATQDWCVVSFEDSKSGDYDYNDLVIHVKYQKASNLFRIGVHPIALGSTKSFQLGYDIFQDGKAVVTDQIVTPNNCRTDLFESTEGMLNTQGDINYDHHAFAWISQSHTVLLGKAVYVRWFIRFDNTKLYAISTAYTSTMLDNANRPYGIVTTATGYTYTQPDQSGVVGEDWFNYPTETKNIDDVYPLFGEWLKGNYKGAFKDMYDPTTPNSFNPAEKGLYVIPSKQTNLF